MTEQIIKAFAGEIALPLIRFVWGNARYLCGPMLDIPIFQFNRRRKRNGFLGNRSLPDPNIGRRRASDNAKFLPRFQTA